MTNSEIGHCWHLEHDLWCCKCERRAYETPSECPVKGVHKAIFVQRLKAKYAMEAS